MAKTDVSSGVSGKETMKVYLFHFYPMENRNRFIRDTICFEEVDVIKTSKMLKCTVREKPLSFYRTQIPIEEIGCIQQRYGSYECVLLNKDVDTFKTSLVVALRIRHEVAQKEVATVEQMISILTKK